jgi:hypothetical protein
MLLYAGDWQDGNKLCKMCLAGCTRDGNNKFRGHTTFLFFEAIFTIQRAGKGGEEGGVGTSLGPMSSGRKVCRLESMEAMRVLS